MARRQSGLDTSPDLAQVELFERWSHSDRLLDDARTRAQRYADRPDLDEEDRICRGAHRGGTARDPAPLV